MPDPKLPSYRRHKPSNQGVVTLNNRDIYLGKWNTAASRAEYDRIVAEWLAAGRTAPPGFNTSDLTVAELAAAYLRFAKGYYRKNGRPTSEIGCIKLAIGHLKGLYGRTPAKDFGPLSLDAVRNAMIEARWTRGTINKEIMRVKRIFRWGVAKELLPPSVDHGLTTVGGLRKGRSEAVETSPVRPVPLPHVDAVKAVVPPQIAAMIQLQLLTGMRPGEVRLMRGCDLNVTGRLWEYRPSEHKTEHYDRSERIILLGPQAQRVLGPLLKPDLSAYIFTPLDAELARSAERRRKRVSKMTPSQAKRRRKRNDYGPLYNKDSYSRVIREACKRAGVPSWHPHQLRHNAGTNVRRQEGLEAAQVFLGHEDRETTERYAEPDLARAAELALKYG